MAYWLESVSKIEIFGVTLLRGLGTRETTVFPWELLSGPHSRGSGTTNLDPYWVTHISQDLLVPEVLLGRYSHGLRGT